MKKWFSVEQIVAVLKQAELGLPVADLIRGLHRPRDEILTQVEDPNIIYRVAVAPSRLRLRGGLPPDTGLST